MSLKRLRWNILGKQVYKTFNKEVRWNSRIEWWLTLQDWLDKIKYLQMFIRKLYKIQVNINNIRLQLIDMKMSTKMWRCKNQNKKQNQ